MTTKAPLKSATPAPLWPEVLAGAEKLARADDALAVLLLEVVLPAKGFVDGLTRLLPAKLACRHLPEKLLHDLFLAFSEGVPDLEDVIIADMQTIMARDPAAKDSLVPFLFFKGFHALVTHRFAHALWRRGRRDFALYLQSQGSRIFSVDIHPAARFGQGIMLDHATGFVVGETAVVGDNCSFLHAVTLGGSGKETGDRHPKIGDQVLIGAGAKVLGNIKVGSCSRIAAGSSTPWAHSATRSSSASSWP